MKIVLSMLTGLACLGAAGCTREGDVRGPADLSQAAADIRMADGRVAARAELTRTGEGLRVSVESVGLRPGTYGVHLHAVGRCDAPGFESAGPHWNPTRREHGSLNPQGPHHGDLPNLSVGTQGAGTLIYEIDGAELAGRDGLLDEDGAAIIVHAGPDDYRTNPSGNSGARIACGIIG